jgi:hypothetical protein
MNGGTATEGKSAVRLFSGSLGGEINIRLCDLAELVTGNRQLHQHTAAVGDDNAPCAEPVLH